MYRTILDSILFYNKWFAQLKAWGFEKNPYEKCTFNKAVDGEKLIVQIHVDNIFTTHKGHCVLDNFIRELNKVFVKEKKLEEMKGFVHDYLGFTIDFLLPGKVAFSMFDYLEDINSRSTTEPQNQTKV